MFRSSQAPASRARPARTEAEARVGRRAISVRKVYFSDQEQTEILAVHVKKLRRFGFGLVFTKARGFYVLELLILGLNWCLEEIWAVWVRIKRGIDGIKRWML